MKLARNLTAALAAVLAVAGCDDDPTSPADAITEEEAVALFAGVAALVSDTTLVPIHFSEDSIVVGCPQGGQAKLVVTDISAGSSGDTAWTTVDVTLAPNGCVVSSGGLTFTTGGDPDFRYLVVVEIIGVFDEVNVTGLVAGGVTWQIGGDRSGSCAMDLTLASAPDLSDPDNPQLGTTFRGKLCGHDVEIDASSLVSL